MKEGFSMLQRHALIKRCHAMARDAFGADRLANRMRAYEYFLKKYIADRFGKFSRAEVSDEEWLEVEKWLREILSRKRGKSFLQAKDI